MTEIPRVIIGQRGNDMGLWVSRPGVNVHVATEDQLLVSPDTANLRFLMQGQYTRSSPFFIFYGAVLRNVPIVWAQVRRGGITLVPSLQVAVPRGTAVGRSPTYTVSAAKDFMQISGAVQYLVLGARLDA